MPQGRKPQLKTTTKKRTEVRTPGITTYAKSKKTIDWSQSYTSLLLGIVVVIIGVLFITSLIKSHNASTQETSSMSTTNAPQVTPTPTPYVVQQGDNLWDIAVNVYHDGFKWKLIAQANHLDTPSLLNAGQQLIIPSVAATPSSSFGTIIATPTPAETMTATTTTITGDSYVVQKGDTLWDIAVKAYANGYRWTDIAKANHLENPGLIFSGNILTLPR